MASPCDSVGAQKPFAHTAEFQNSGLRPLVAFIDPKFNTADAAFKCTV
jgi:hypothetical protein